jgi:MFS family permease
MDHTGMARKITTTLFAAQSLGSAGFIAVSTVSSIVGAMLSGNPALAGLPSAVYLLGSAVAALVSGAIMDRVGRRGGMVIGLLFGVAGSGFAARAIGAGSFPLFLLGMGVMGVAQAGLQLGRFAAAEVSPPEQRGRAISNVVIGGAVGAVFGPLLVGPTGRLAAQAGLDELAGPFGIAMLLFVIAGMVIFLRLRPDPRDLGREIARLYPTTDLNQGRARPLSTIFHQPAPMLALTTMVFGQVVMVMLMVITSLHMKQHQHGLSDISLVISSHTFGMFGFSIFSGRLADRWGRGQVILVGSVTLVLACLAAPLSPDVLPLAVALFLLGLGWNFCYVGGSSLLADHLMPEERARAQGFNDLLIGLVSATGGLGSGVVFATLGYDWMGIVGVVFAVVPAAMTAWWLITKRGNLIAAE